MLFRLSVNADSEIRAFAVVTKKCIDRNFSSIQFKSTNSDSNKIERRLAFGPTLTKKLVFDMRIKHIESV